MIVYGIKNCDTVKKALQWLDERDLAYEFHDYKTKGVSKDKLSSWCKQLGWEKLVNKKGMTWRQLDEKAKVTNQTDAIALMMEKTSVIKRPLIERNDEVVVLGFDAAEFGLKLML